MDNFLLVGLGNPGKRYEKTRHNIGFEVIKFLAKQENVILQENSKFLGSYGKTIIEDRQVHLLMPTTFMNESGHAVRKCSEYFKIAFDHMLIVVDDADLSFSQMRLKMNSSAGGHRGLVSIEESLHTDTYPRLRIGIGRNERHLTDYVLGCFTEEERLQLPQIYAKAGSIIHLWLKEGMIKAMNEINRKITKSSEEEK